jgi:hypothetical protein
VTDDDLDQARRAVAEVHGLDETAAGFLTGRTIEELETAANELAELVAANRGQAPEQVDPLTEALQSGPALKAARQRALVQALHRRPEQPRDERGRYAGFDGGARRSTPQPQSPVEAHDELIVTLSQFSRVYSGGQF